MHNLFGQLDELSDPIRCRILLGLDHQELTVGELKTVLQLPQSTVSRHLKVLADGLWITGRAEGVSNWYRGNRNLDPAARALWDVVRAQVADADPALRDAERIKAVVAARHERTRDFFATGAAQWDHLRAEMFGEGLEWMAMAGLLDPEWVVADLGTGTGPLAAAVAPFVRQVIAVDESPAMLEAAARRTGALGSIDYRQGALESLPINSASVDLACSVLVLHHLAEPDKAVDEAARVLKPRGQLVIMDMRPHERAEYRETMGHQWLGFDVATVTRWCSQAGLSAPSYRSLTPKSDTQGPLLFVAAARKLH